jgi:DNA-directed RNA polymerase specialized sigma24 family protein
VQDALLPAYKHLNQFRGDAHISTWLAAIVTNWARMQLRKRPRHTQYLLDSRIEEEQGHSRFNALVDDRPKPEDECHESRLNAWLINSAARLSPPPLQENVSIAVCE